MSPLELVVVVALLTVAAVPPDDGDKQEKAKLQGVWARQSAVVDGRDVPDGGERTRLVYDGARFTVRTGDKVTGEGTATHNPARDPKEFDLTWTAGDETSKTCLGIYYLDGETYIACVAAPGGARPKAFTSRPGSGRRLFVFRRERAGFAPPPAGRDAPDPELLAAIYHIKAVDNHCHAVSPADQKFAEQDLDRKPPFALPVRLQVDNPEVIGAWRALYGYAHPDMDLERRRELLKVKQALVQEKGRGFPAWALDRAGIDVALVNMPKLGPGLEAPRFRWVPHADGFLFPFAQESEGVKDVRKRLNLDEPPPTLAEYLKWMTGLLTRWKKDDAVAVKFGIAYFRPLDFADVKEEEARAIYERYARGGGPSAAELKALQDYLFRYAAAEAGKLRLAVHIHTGGGASTFFDINGSNPMLLGPVFNDRRLRDTTFVMVHGGGSLFEKQAGALLMKPNVYADFSAKTFLLSTRALSQTLRDLLEWYPEKVLFGTDASGQGAPLRGWEEMTWLTTRTSREALALALTGMMNDGQITHARAVELARMVLRDNAVKLYGLEKS